MIRCSVDTSGKYIPASSLFCPTKTSQVALTFDVKVSRKVSVNDHRLSQLALVNNTLHLRCDRKEAGPHRLHEEDAIFLCCSEKGLEFWGVGGGRLLAKDVLLRTYRSQSLVVVESMG